ncbi:DUF881 domain-containing protein [Aestuariimicrobium kwangyangense]|uniref:DUF881 domain-containing protein n=1 Tax=Aestuariimicrobium kwangyangense TaxID=396389 RepID=UPI0003B77B35|nr:DUF881 domain-containing protein [Aestuariimicrobium kwangyangense]
MPDEASPEETSPEETNTGGTAGAATTTPPTAPRLTWRRMLSDLVRPSRAQAFMAIVLCLLTTAIIWQVRVRSADDTYAGMRRADLVQILDQLNANATKLRQDIANEEAAQRDLQSGADSRKVAQEKANARLKELQVLAGTVAATGPGIVITVVDPEHQVTGDMVLDAVEEMRDAGAEAVDVNGVRVVAQTWFGGSAGAVTVNGAPLQPPYVITVIGEPHALEEGARFRGGLVSQVQAPQVGARVDISTRDSVEITSTTQPKQPRFAQPTR